MDCSLFILHRIIHKSKTMKRNNVNFTVFPYRKNGDDSQFYNVGKAECLTGTFLGILLDTIVQRDDNTDWFRYMDGIHIIGLAADCKKAVLEDLENAENLGYCMVEAHFKKDIKGDESFYFYLKERIEQEYIGNISHIICWKEGDIELIVLFFNNYISIPAVNI